MKYEKSCGAVVIEDNKVLLVKHNIGHWGFPKGHVEGNETEKETAKREVKEETNIEITIISDNRYKITYSPKKGIEKDVIFFIARANSKDIYPQEIEISEVKFVNYESAKKLITYDEERKVLLAVISDLNSNNLT